MPIPEFQPRAAQVSSVDVLRRFLLYVVVVAAIVSDVLGLLLIHSIRQTQITNTGISRNTNLTAKQVKALVATVQDCQTGKCAKANAEKIAAIIKQINAAQKRNTILAVVCENTPGVPNSPLAVSRCVAHYVNSAKGN